MKVEREDPIRKLGKMRDSAVTVDDVKLLDALRIWPRASWTDLARIIGSTPSTLQRRWERLSSERIAKATVEHVSDAGPGHLSIVVVHVQPQARSGLLTTIAEMPFVSSMEDLLNYADCAVQVSFPTPAALNDQFLADLRSLPGVERLEVMIVTHVHFTGATWWQHSLTPDQVGALNALRPVKPLGQRRQPPTAQELEVIDVLRQDARISTTALAARIGVAESTARRLLTRVLRLPGVRLRVVISPVGANHATTVTFFLNAPVADHAAIAQYVRRDPRTRLSVSLLGPMNFMFASFVENGAEAEEVLNGVLEHFPSARFLESPMTLRRRKETGWVFTDDGLIDHYVPVPATKVDDGAADPDDDEYAEAADAEETCNGV